MPISPPEQKDKSKRRKHKSTLQECLQVANEDIRERLAVLEEKEDNNNSRIKNQAIRIERLEGDNVLLAKMSTILEYQSESLKQQKEEFSTMRKEHNQQMKEFGNVMTEVNTNLSNLNTKYEQMEANMESLGDEMKGMKKVQKEEADKTKISTGELLTKMLIAILMVIPTAVCTWLLIKMGLK